MTTLAVMPTYRILPSSDSALTPIVFDAVEVKTDGETRVLTSPETSDGTATLRVPSVWRIEELEAT